MSIDLSNLLVNLSHSLIPVQALATGLAYLFGIILFYNGLEGLRGIANHGRRGREHLFPVLANFVGGAALLFLPTMVQILANTAFGTNNVLQYASFKTYGLLEAVRIMIQTAGVVWFFRGVILLVHASEPGEDEGPKGLAMLVAGIFGIYFNETMDAVNYFVNLLMNHMTLTNLTNPAK